MNGAVARGWYRASLLVSDTTLETPHALGPEGRRPERESGGPPGSTPPFLVRYVWWFVALGIVVIAAAMLRWANTRPGYDPYGWLIWGYQTLHGSLNLGGAPSWKPFTYVFTVPYSIFGHYALHLWMVTSVSIALAGAVFGGRIAYRLTAAEGDSRWAPIVAAVVAGAAVLGIQEYFHYVLSVQSDPMLVTCCLAAIDMFLCRRLAWAWWIGVLAGLGRPEVWPFLVVYGIWLFLKRPNLRWMIYAAAIITLFLWFGVPTITNGKPDIAGQLALKSPRELHSNKVAGTIDRVKALNYWPVWLGALVAVGLAVWRRNRTVLVLAGMVVAWVVIEIAFVLHGFPGVPRYLFEPAGLAGVLAGVAIGWLLLDASRFSRALPSWAGIPVAVILLAVMIPQGISQARAEHKDISHERARTVEINKLGAAIAALGGPSRILSCGHPVLNVEYVSVMGWYLHQNTGDIGYRPVVELGYKRPTVLFTTFRNGWGITPYYETTTACQRLKSLYVPTARHPEGVLVPK
jgi:hypothetical protein